MNVHPNPRPPGLRPAAPRARFLPIALLFAIAPALGGAQSGEATFPFEARVNSGQPVEVQGALAAVPVEGAVGLVAAIEAFAPLDASQSFESPAAHVTIHRWVHAIRTVHVDGSPARLPGENQTTEFAATNVSIALERLGVAPQVGAVAAPASGESTSTLSTVSLQCGVSAGDRSRTMRFPRDDAKHRAADFPLLPMGPLLLTAECATGAIEVAGPARLFWYGMDVRLASVERNELIRTGTFDEPQPPLGLVRRVTVVLELQHQAQEGLLDLPLPARATLRAARFLSAGDLWLPAGEGALRWGDYARDGPLDAVSTEGIFDLSRAAHRTVAVDGRSLRAPPDSPGAASPGPAGPGLALWALTVAAVGLIGILPHALGLLFSKIAPERVLDHPRRARILELVRHQPGIQPSELRRAMGLAWGPISHHTTILRRAGHLRMERFGGRTGLYAAGRLRPADAARAHLLRRPGCARVYQALAGRPGLTQAEVGGLAGLSQPRVSQVLAQLHAHGLVGSIRVGASRRYAPFP